MKIGLRIRILLALLLSVAMLSSCSKNDEETADCQSAIDCPEGYYCSPDGACNKGEQSCKLSSECSFRQFCKDGICTSDACASSADCGKGAVCTNGHCRIGCHENNDCQDGLFCLAGECRSGGCTEGSCGKFKKCDSTAQPPVCVYDGSCDRDAICNFYGSQKNDLASYYCSRSKKTCVKKASCARDTECTRKGEICVVVDKVEGKDIKGCREGCRSNKQCGSGRVCVANPNPNFNWNICQRGCNNASDCLKSSEVCIDKVCTKTCQLTSECPNGQVCDSDAYTNGETVCMGCRVPLGANDKTGCLSSQKCNGSLMPENSLRGLCEDIISCPDDNYQYVDLTDETKKYPNNSFVRAVKVELPLETSSSVEKQPVFCSDPNITSQGEYFKFDLDKASYIYVSIQYTIAGGNNLDLFLFDSANSNDPIVSRVNSNDNGSESLRYGFSGLNLGELKKTFIVKVSGTVNSDTYIPYVLNIKTEPIPQTCPPDEGQVVFTGNSTIDDAEANNSSLNKDVTYDGLNVCGKSPDFYKLCVDNESRVILQTKNDPSLGELKVSVLKAEGSHENVALSNPKVEGDKTTIEFENTKDLVDQNGNGKTCFFAEVKVKSNAGNVKYSLKWRSESLLCNDIFETGNGSNNECKDVLKDYENLRNRNASFLDRNTMITQEGFKPPKSVAACNEYDNYCFEILPEDRFNFNMCYPEKANDTLSASLFTTNGKDCVDSKKAYFPSLNSNSEQCINISEQLEAGIYCIKVYSDHGIYVPYSFQAKIVPGPACNDGGATNHTANDATEFDVAKAKMGKDNVKLGTLCDKQSDWYKITASKSFTIENYYVGNAKIDMTLYTGNVDDPNPIVVHGSAAKDVTPPSTNTTYYIKIAGNPSARAKYRLLLTYDGHAPISPKCVDAFEDNDDEGHPYTLASSSSSSPEDLTVCGQSGNIDPDYFKYDLQAGDTATLVFTFADNNEQNKQITSEIKKKLSNETTTRSLNSFTLDSITKTRTVSYTAYEDTELHIKVSTTALPGETHYKLAWSKTHEACNDDSFSTGAQPNDSATDAKTIDLKDFITQEQGQFTVKKAVLQNLNLCPGKNDWFKVELPPHTKAAFFSQFDMDHSKNLNIDVYNSVSAQDSDKVGTSLTNGYGKSVKDVENNTSKPATFWVKISSTNSASVKYVLLIKLIESTSSLSFNESEVKCPDMFESNDNSSTVKTYLPFGTYHDLLICHENNNNDVDFFWLAVPPESTVTATLSFDNSKGNIDAFLYDSTGKMPIADSNSNKGSSTGDGNEEKVLFVNTQQKPTSVYLKVESHMNNPPQTVAPFNNLYTLKTEVTYNGSCSQLPSPFSTTLAGATTPLANNYNGVLQKCKNNDTHFVYLGSSTTISNVHAYMRFSESFGSLQMELLSASNAQGANAQSVGFAKKDDQSGWYAINYKQMVSGTFYYFLKISGSKDQFAIYKLQYFTSGSNDFCGDRYEVNDSTLTAYKLPKVTNANIHRLNNALICGSESDWFYFHVKANSNNKKTYIAVFGKKDIKVDIKKLDGGSLTPVSGLSELTIPGSNGSSYGVVEFRHQLPAGDYYLKVSSSDTNAAGLYNVYVQTDVDDGKVVANNAQCIAIEETTNSDNSQASSADNLTADKVVAATLCSSDLDYYKYTLPAKTSVDIVIISATESATGIGDHFQVLNSGDNPIGKQSADGVLTFTLSNNTGAEVTEKFYLKSEISNAPLTLQEYPYTIIVGKETSIP